MRGSEKSANHTLGLERPMSEAEINKPLPVLVLDTIFVEVLSAQDKYPLHAHLSPLDPPGCRQGAS